MQNLTTNEEVQFLLTKFGLDFTIIKEQLQTANGLETPFFGLRNSKTNEFLNAVKAGYTVSQNDEILDMVLKGMKPFSNDLSMKNAFSLGGGKKILMQLAINGLSIAGDEKIERYVTIVDSNDGSSGLAVGIGEKVLSCQNQFFMFYKNAQSKFRHTASINARIKEIPQLIEVALSESMKLTKYYEVLQGKKIPTNVTDKLVSELLGLSKSNSVLEISEASTRKTNAMDSLYNHIEKETNQKGQNLFGLFSGVTSWTTHEKSVPTRENGRIESIATGTNYNTNRDAFKFIQQVASTM